MSFGTVINCMDGRVQIPVIEYLKDKYKVKFIDTITAAGPDGLIARHSDPSVINNINHRIRISVNSHGSSSLAVVGHYDCAGNPVLEEEHIRDIKKAAAYLKTKHEDLSIIGLWVNENWQVIEVA